MVSNNKKIRGWKRQIYKIEKWYEKHKHPNVELLKGWQEAYVKIWIDPWYRLEKRNPPIWYFRLILDQLDKMYFDWRNAFEKSDFPHDLQIWLHERSYIRSELVCARVEQYGEQRNNFFHACSEQREFPTEKFISRRFNPDNFEWALYYDVISYYEKLDNLNLKEMNRLRSNGYKETVIFKDTDNQQINFWKPRDYVWIGRKTPGNKS